MSLPIRQPILKTGLPAPRSIELQAACRGAGVLQACDPS